MSRKLQALTMQRRQLAAQLASFADVATAPDAAKRPIDDDETGIYKAVAVRPEAARPSKPTARKRPSRRAGQLQPA